MTAFQTINAGSFRDPSGFVFSENGSIYRQVNYSYREEYDYLMDSGLYQALVDNRLMVSHQEIDPISMGRPQAYKIIKPDPIPFISYPYEWGFSQFKLAALTTLNVQKTSLTFNMSLKDGSAFNIQFKDGKPIFIDTLSFERLQAGKPWAAYRQFCQHFIAPLALMAKTDVRFNHWLKIFLDGIPMEMASGLLPWRTYCNWSLLTHIHLHAKGQKYLSGKSMGPKNNRISRQGFLGILDSLESTIKKLEWTPSGTEWVDYYDHTNYTPSAFEHKQEIVSRFLDEIHPATVWDLGANTGFFSRLAARKSSFTVSFDMDPAAVEKNFLQSMVEAQGNILPLLLDLTNPTPGIGWENRERLSLLDRGPVEAVLALSLIHHLAISHNVPLALIARFLSKASRWLIIEFIPKEDSYAQRLLASRKDIFSEYHQSAFEREFNHCFQIKSLETIRESGRTIYLMENVEPR